MRAGLRVTPWLVTAGTLAFGTWFFRALVPQASHGALAAVGIGFVLFRVTAAVAAVSVGTFALAAGLEGRWFSGDPLRRRRFAALAALGASSILLGTFIVVGPMAGMPIARSLGVVGSAGLLVALSAWSMRSLRRGQAQKEVPRAINAPSVGDEWMLRDLGRVKTPAT